MKRGAWLRLAAAAVVAAVLLAGVAEAKKKSAPEVTHTVRCALAAPPWRLAAC